jgi:peptidoglycan hydrolase-like protein with peptidoglycan-binding domain
VIRRLVVVGAVVAVSAVATVSVVARRHDHVTPRPSAVATTTVQRGDLVATQRVNATLTYAPAPPVLVRRPGTYTSLPAEGSVVAEGQPVATVDGRPVVLLIGTTGAWRSFAVGMTDGPDVAQLEQDLVDLGFAAGITVDEHFTTATATAVRRWQAALGEQVSGVVADGDVVFLPEPVRVGPFTASVGGPVVAGQAPYAATSANRVAEIDLDAARQQGVDVGTPVTVDLPGGAHTSGKIATVGRVATIAAPADGGSGPSRPSVPVTISLDDPAAAGDFDRQPVQVEFVTESRTNVLTVPVTALLALAEGGYGVEVVSPHGPHAIVAVTTGLFASGRVELQAGVSEGTVVVVAQ